MYAPVIYDHPFLHHGVTSFIPLMAFRETHHARRQCTRPREPETGECRRVSSVLKHFNNAHVWHVYVILHFAGCCTRREAHSWAGMVSLLSLSISIVDTSIHFWHVFLHFLFLCMYIISAGVMMEVSELGINVACLCRHA